MTIFFLTVLARSSSLHTTGRCEISSSAFKKLGIEYSPTTHGLQHEANLVKLVVVHLTDSIILSRPSLYVSSLLLALRSMLQMDLPHLNVLTKIDNLRNYPNLPFNLDFYTEVQDLH